jgi:hypothetical protein
MQQRLLPVIAVFALAAAAPAQAESPPVTTADISVAMTATDAQTVPSRGPFVSPVTYTVTVTNAGPEQASGITLAIELTGHQAIQEVTSQSGICTTTATAVTCGIDAIAPGRAEVVQVTTMPDSTADLGARANATSSSVDTHPGNNFAAATPEIVVVDPQPPPPTGDTTPPDTRITAPGRSTRGSSFRVFRGRAADAGTGVTGVELAVQRIDAGCRALTGPRGRFADPQPCTQLRWLRATGTNNWSYKLKSALPKGRYRVYSRATDGAGLVETGWTKADRNVVRFAVR